MNYQSVDTLAILEYDEENHSHYFYSNQIKLDEKKYLKSNSGSLYSYAFFDGNERLYLSEFTIKNNHIKKYSEFIYKKGEQDLLYELYTHTLVSAPTHLISPYDEMFLECLYDMPRIRESLLK